MSESKTQHPFYPYLLFARGAQVALALLIVWKAHFQALPVFLGIQLALFALIEALFFLAVHLKARRQQREEEEMARQHHEAQRREKEEAFREAQKAAAEKYLEVDDFYKWRREQEQSPRKRHH